MKVSLFNKDSTVGMPEILTSSVDLVLTSPPYWNIVDYDHPSQLGVGFTYKHYLHLLKNNIMECMRVIKEDGFAAFVVGDVRKGNEFHQRPRLYPIHSDLIQFFIEMDFDFFQHFFWLKRGVKKGKKEGVIYGSVGLGEQREFAAPLLYSDLLAEHILVFRKQGKKRRFPPLKEMLQDEYTRIRKDELREMLNPVWELASPVTSNHPATFPGEIAKRLIQLFSIKGDCVLDPFCGSGTTLMEALKLRRNAYGYEIKTDYLHAVEQNLRTAFPEICIELS